MNSTGFSSDSHVKPETLLSRFNAFRDRYRIQTSVALAVIASLAFIAAAIVPVIKHYIITSGLVEYITLLVILDLSVSVYKTQRQPTIKITHNQDESMPRLIEALLHCRNEHVDLLEYAAATTLPLIRAIQRKGIPLRILIKHPDTIDGVQKNRSIATLDTICNSIFENYQASFEIRCYKLPYTVRGRCLGKEYLELGWLTADVKRQTAFGHGNPSFIADLSNRDNKHLHIFFNTTFETYWNDPETEVGTAVLERLNSSS